MIMMRPDYRKLLLDIKDIFNITASFERSDFFESDQLRIGAQIPNIYIQKVDLKTKVIVQRFAQKQVKIYEHLESTNNQLDLLKNKTKLRYRSETLFPHDRCSDLTKNLSADAQYPLLESYSHWAVVVAGEIKVNHNLDPADLRTTIKVLQTKNAREVAIKDGVLYGHRVGEVSTIVFSRATLDEVDQEIIVLQTIWASHLFDLSKALVESERLSDSLKEKNEFLRFQAIELLQALEAKATFLAHMSHEVRTPLNGILGAAQLLNSTELSTAQKELINIQLDSGTHLRKIIDAILDLSKIESGQFELDLEIFEWHQMIEQCIDGISPLSDEKGLCIDCSTELQKPLWVKGDLTRIRQCLLNLLSNAIKFTEQGRIAIRSRCEEKDLYTIEVCDQGVGIDPEYVEELFNPFRQAKGQSNHVLGGTGLGLPLVRKFCRLHGGDVGAYCNIGVGSTFWANFILSECEAPETVPQMLQNIEEINETEATLSILVVDDNEVNRVIAKKLLQSLGAEVILAKNGQEAVEYVKCNAHYDLVLMDCMMPVMDGFRATKIIRTELNNQDLPIYALTAAVTKEEQSKCLQAGMNGICFKPIKKEELHKLLQKY